MVTLPPGKYIISDPCYIVPRNQWNDVLAQSDCFTCPEATFKADGGEEVKVVAFSTLYGDGVFEDQYGNEYGVDAGLIGIIQADYIGTGDSVVHQFDQSFECFSHGGVLFFGNVVINTGSDEEENEY